MQKAASVTRVSRAIGRGMGISRLLIRADRHLAGFVLVSEWSALGLPLDHVVAEFFVLRKYRRARAPHCLSFADIRANGRCRWPGTTRLPRRSGGESPRRWPRKKWRRSPETENGGPDRCCASRQSRQSDRSAAGVLWTVRFRSRPGLLSPGEAYIRRGFLYFVQSYQLLGSPCLGLCQVIWWFTGVRGRLPGIEVLVGEAGVDRRRVRDQAARLPPDPSTGEPTSRHRLAVGLLIQTHCNCQLRKENEKPSSAVDRHRRASVFGRSGIGAGSRSAAPCPAPRPALRFRAIGALWRPRAARRRRAQGGFGSRRQLAVIL
jgi:hypothetical protein